MVCFIEQGYSTAAVHPRNSIFGGNPEVFFLVEKEAVYGFVWQARSAIDDPQDIALRIDQDDSTEKSADGQGIIVNRDGTGEDVVLDELTAVTRQESELGTLKACQTGRGDREKCIADERFEETWEVFGASVVRHQQHRLVAVELPEAGVKMQNVDGVADLLGNRPAGIFFQWPDMKRFSVPPHDLVGCRKDDAARGRFDAPNGEPIAVFGWKLGQQRLVA